MRNYACSSVFLCNHSRWYGVKLRHFGLCAFMLRCFYLCCYAPTFRRLYGLLCSDDVSEAICALMLRRFGGLMLCSDVSGTVMLRRFGTAVMLRRFGPICYAPTFRVYLWCYVPTFRIISDSMLRHFGDCVLMLRRFGCYMCYNAPKFRRLSALMIRRFGDCAIMLRRFGAICCYAPTFRKMSVLICSHISETICAVIIRVCSSLFLCP